MPPVEDDNVNESQFCTQPPAADFVPDVVGESPDPMVHEQGVVGGDSFEHSGRGPHHNGPLPAAANHSLDAAALHTESTTYPDLAEGAAGMNEEVASSPQEPFLGMRFDSILMARDHYNAYALKLGFSIKANTSKRDRNTNTLEKQQFVCNKYRRPKSEEEEEEEQREKMTVVEDVSPIQLDGDGAEDGEGVPSRSKSSSRLGVKRKREMIKQTKCPARMFVKLINNKWEVTYFVAEHNHPMIVKPSLTKYLRSHRGIPSDEKEFLRCLHNCNLETCVFF